LALVQGHYGAVPSVVSHIRCDSKAIHCNWLSLVKHVSVSALRLTAWGNADGYFRSSRSELICTAVKLQDVHERRQIDFELGSLQSIQDRYCLAFSVYPASMLVDVNRTTIKFNNAADTRSALLFILATRLFAPTSGKLGDAFSYIVFGHRDIRF